MKGSALRGVAAVLAIAMSVPMFLGAACTSSEPADLAQIEDIHVRMDPDDIDDLKDIIKGESDDYVRERAVLVLADIAIRANRADDITDFLKELAYEEESDQVRSAAYSTLDQIRQFYPLEVGAGLDLRIDGDIYEGSTVQLVAVCYCEKDVYDAAVGIRLISSLETGSEAGVVIGSPNPVRFSLEGGESKEVVFDLVLDEPGRYDVVVTLDLGFDRLDSISMDKTAQIRVEASGGAYQVTPAESTVPEEKGGLSGGWIALISVLSVVAAAALAFMILMLRGMIRNRRDK